MVERFIQKHRLIPKGATIVVGVSGGPDSMALLYFLHQRRQFWNIKLIACCVDHQLRGEDSRKDLLFVETFCQQYGIAFEGKTIDVPQIMQDMGISVETAARLGRYQAFEEVMVKQQADCLALGHHGDDQIETMLMRQVRGSFGAARAGMPVQRTFANGYIIRPFLSVTKEQIEQYCHNAGIVPRIDPSNFSEAITRNRFRKHVLPFLKQENPLVHLRFQEDSERIRDDSLYLDSLAQEKLQSVVVEQSTTHMVISIRRLIDTPIPLQRRMIHLILKYLYNHDHKEAYHQSIHIEEVLYWLSVTKSSGERHLPKGLLVKRSYDLCHFIIGKEEARQTFSIGSSKLRLTIPGLTKAPLARVLAEVIHTYPTDSLNPNEFICDFDLLEGPLYLRHRKPGDRLRPLGMKGTKKVKDLFIDKKIDRQDRDRWLFLVDQGDQIVWIPFLRRGELYRVTSRTKRFLKLTIETTAFGRTF
ncbi:tRNA lysidine(34) synthetase TilS [Pullulanibacillus pueri]|nr:tRNA lysidine(34) synthetase TilS [Pullulanibacillus pueri]